MMSDLDPAGIHNVKPNPGAVIHLGNGQQVYVIEDYGRACELWEEAERLVEFTAYSDFKHTDERVTYRLTIPVPLIMRVDEFSDAMSDAVDRDQEKHKQECLKSKPTEQRVGIFPVGGMALEFGPEGMRILDPKDTPEEPTEEEGDDDGDR